MVVFEIPLLIHSNMQMIEDISAVKESRNSILDQLRWRRKKFRLPIVEVNI
jgi:hypothetical protein